MIIDSKKAEEQAVLNLAYQICAAMRTAPKARGNDQLQTAILTGEDKDKVAAEMRRIGEKLGDKGKIFPRDAGNVDASLAIVLVGTKHEGKGLNDICSLCGFADCAACANAGSKCMFTSIDLGIALGSAVSLVSDSRIDNRIMFSIGKAAAALGLLGEYKTIMGIPLAVRGKSPFFDRG